MYVRKETVDREFIPKPARLERCPWLKKPCVLPPENRPFEAETWMTMKCTNCLLVQLGKRVDKLSKEVKQLSKDTRDFLTAVVHRM